MPRFYRLFVVANGFNDTDFHRMEIHVIEIACSSSGQKKKLQAEKHRTLNHFDDDAMGKNRNHEFYMNASLMRPQFGD